MGIAASGVGLGALAIFPWMQWVLDAYGWREACWILALLLLAIVLPVNLLLPRRHPSELGLHPEGDGAAGDGQMDGGGNPRAADPSWAAIDWTLSTALRTPRYWYLWFGIFGALFAWYCIQVHQTRYLIDVGFSPATAAWALTLVGVTGIAGLIGIGHLSDRIGREWGWTAACGGYVVCYALLLVIEHVPSAPLMYVMVGAQGFLRVWHRFALRIGGRRSLSGPAFRDDLRDPEPRCGPRSGGGSMGRWDRLRPRRQLRARLRPRRGPRGGVRRVHLVGRPPQGAAGGVAGAPATRSNPSVIRGPQVKRELITSKAHVRF